MHVEKRCYHILNFRVNNYWNKKEQHPQTLQHCCLVAVTQTQTPSSVLLPPHSPASSWPGANTISVLRFGIRAELWPCCESGRQLYSPVLAFCGSMSNLMFHFARVPLIMAAGLMEGEGLGHHMESPCKTWPPAAPRVSKRAHSHRQ